MHLPIDFPPFVEVRALICKATLYCGAGQLSERATPEHFRSSFASECGNLFAVLLAQVTVDAQERGKQIGRVFDLELGAALKYRGNDFGQKALVQIDPSF